MRRRLFAGVMSAALLGGSTRGYVNAYQVITNLGLTTNLKMVLDAGALASYTSGQKWLDLAGGGYDFLRGTTTGADATDPTFNGVAGALTSAEYFSTDGGDYFTYDTTNESWMTNIHKDGAKWSLAMWFYTTTIASPRALIGTDNGGASNVGFNIITTAGASIRPRVSNGSGTFALDYNPGSPDLVSGWNFLGVAVDETDATSGVRIVVNGSTAAASGVYTSPSAAGATSTMNILAEGAGTLPALNTDRIAAVMMWEGTTLSAANLDSIYQSTRARFGV